MAKQSSNALSRLASRILKGAKATQRDIVQLAASVLSQDETRGSRKGKKRKGKKRKTKTRKTKTRKTKGRTATKRK
jgi:hypothetical protein